MSEIDDKVREAKKEMMENIGFSIYRVPKIVKEEFFKYAKDEWADDYGAALAHIWRFFKGECNSGHEEINAKMEILADEISRISIKLKEMETPVQKQKTETRCDGKEYPVN